MRALNPKVTLFTWYPTLLDRGGGGLRKQIIIYFPYGYIINPEQLVEIEGVLHGLP